VSLPRANVLGIEVPVASNPLSRLLGLALIPRERAGAGLLLTECRGVHTFGMRFRIDLVFLGAAGQELRRVRGLAPGRFATTRGAGAVLELPAGQAGDDPVGARRGPDGPERP
jgi:uncharacterized membrane protein (UPF0127 family)